MVARRRYPGIVAQGGLVLLSLAVARVVMETQAIEASPAILLLAIAAALIGVSVMFIGPVYCLAGLLLLTIVRWLPSVSVGGGVDVTAADAFYVGLFVWWVVRLAGLSGSQEDDPRARSPLRWGAAAAFLVYVGLSLVHVGIVDPDRLSFSLISWLRLIQTASVAALAAFFIRTRRDVDIVLAALALAGIFIVIRALVGGVDAGGEGLGERGGGFNPNTLGLVSGLLVLMAAFGTPRSDLLYRVPLAIFGVVGLMQGKSVGALVGTAVALILGLAFMVSPPKRILTVRALRAVTALGMAVAIAYAAAATIRPENLPTSDEFQSSSGGHRTVLGAAGLEIAERNLLIGVGWRRSETPEVIGDSDVTTELRARFRSTNSALFPDVSPGSVHNTYIQVLADLGVIGLVLLALVLWTLWRGIRTVLQYPVRGSPEWRQLWFLAWGVVLIVVWLNDNPLFGGQIETVILAVLLGMIAGRGIQLQARGGGGGEPAAERAR